MAQKTTVQLQVDSDCKNHKYEIVTVLTLNLCVGPTLPCLGWGPNMDGDTTTANDPTSVFFLVGPTYGENKV